MGLDENPNMYGSMYIAKRKKEKSSGGYVWRKILDNKSVRYFLLFIVAISWFMVIYYDYQSISKLDTYHYDPIQVENENDFNRPKLQSFANIKREFHSEEMTVMFGHEYVPYLGHHGADTRLIQVIEAFQIFKKVYFVPYTSLLGKGCIENWEIPTQLHITALEATGTYVIPTNFHGKEENNPKANFRLLLDQYKPDIVMTTLWFWTWPLRPLFASVVIEVLLKYMKDTENQDTFFLVLSDDFNSERENHLLGASADGIKIAPEISNLLMTNLELNPTTQTLQQLQMTPKDKSNILKPSIDRVAKMRSFENLIYGNADAIITITDRDRQRYIKTLKVSPSAVYSLRMATSGHQTNHNEVLSFEKRDTIIFVGSGKNPTNFRGMLWFLIEVWPVVQSRLPNIYLEIIGEEPDIGWGGITKTHLESMNIRIYGFQKELKPFLDKAKVFICPIQEETGLNTKNLLAINHGIPLVATSAGAAGFPLEKRLDFGIYAHDEVDGMAQFIITLYQEEEIWKNASRNVLHIAETYFTLEKFKEEFNLITKTILRDRTVHKNIESIIKESNYDQSNYCIVQNTVDSLK